MEWLYCVSIEFRRDRIQLNGIMTNSNVCLRIRGVVSKYNVCFAGIDLNKVWYIDVFPLLQSWKTYQIDNEWGAVNANDFSPRSKILVRCFPPFAFVDSEKVLVGVGAADDMLIGVWVELPEPMCNGAEQKCLWREQCVDLLCSLRSPNVCSARHSWSWAQSCCKRTTWCWKSTDLYMPTSTVLNYLQNPNWSNSGSAKERFGIHARHGLILTSIATGSWLYARHLIEWNRFAFHTLVVAQCCIVRR